jgi:hypothetical protein
MRPISLSQENLARVTFTRIFTDNFPMCIVSGIRSLDKYAHKIEIGSVTQSLSFNILDTSINVATPNARHRLHRDNGAKVAPW